MGIYQAYAAVAVALSVLLILKQCLSHRAQCKETAVLGVRLLAFLAVGAVAYYVILQVFLKVKGLELLEYLGMSQAGSGYPIAQLPSLLLSAYKQVVVFFFVPGSSTPLPLRLWRGWMCWPPCWLRCAFLLSWCAAPCGGRYGG